jgi:hypothetical protein
MNRKEIVFPLCIVDLHLQALLRTGKLLLKVLVLGPFLLRGLLNEPVFPLDLVLQISRLPVEVNNIRILGVKLLHEFFGYRVRSAGIASNAHVCKGPSKSIIRDVTLEEGVLHIKPNKLISISYAKDPSEGVMPQHPVTYRIRSST